MTKARRARLGVASGAAALLALGMTARLAPAQNAGTAAPTGGIRRLLSVSDPIAAPNGSFGLGFFRQEGAGSSIIQGVSDDGTLFMSDYAGVSLLRFATGAARTAAAGRQGSGAPEVLLDSSHADPVDGVALARIIKVVTNRQGVSGVLALRADSRYGVYRLTGKILTRLALLPDDQTLLELGIGDAGQIAYFGPNAAGTQSLFQAPVGGAPVEIAREGLRSTSGVTIEQIATGELASNGAGDLVFGIFARLASGDVVHVLIRKQGSAIEVIAEEGERVEIGRGAGVTGTLSTLADPRIGPDGTVVFLGFPKTGDGKLSVNAFVQGPGRPLQALLPASGNFDFDYAVDARGSVAVVAIPEGALYLVAPTGAVSLIVDVTKGIIPTKGLTFDAQGNLFFRAQDPKLARDRYGDFPVRLYVYRRGATPASGAMQPEEVGSTSSGPLRLLSVTQAPVAAPGGAVVDGLVGSSAPFATPAGALFQVALGASATARSSLVAQEADALPGADRVGIPQNLYYTNDGSLVADVILPGGGAAAIMVRGAAGTASAARTQAAPSPAPLAATGQSLGQPDRTLLDFLGALVPVGTDGQLVLARYSQGSGIGEGLFSLSRSGGVDLLADTLHGGSTTRFTSFSEPSGVAWDLPSVSPEGNIVFEAREDRGGAVPQPGVFQWLRASRTAVRMFSEPGSLLFQWEARPGGTADVLALGTRGYELDQCSLDPNSPAVHVETLVASKSTTVSGRGNGAKILVFDDFVSDKAGETFIDGFLDDGGGIGRDGLFRLSPSTKTLEPIVLEGDAVPPFVDGRKNSGLKFTAVTELLRDSRRGPLLFRATVGDGRSSVQGMFTRSAQGQLETLVLEGAAVTGERAITVSALGDAEERQTANGTSAYAVKDDQGWMILRSRAVLDARGQPVLDSNGTPKFATAVIVRDGQQLEAGRSPVTLNAGPLVSPAGQAPRQGPIFTLNDAGDVAFFASDGQRWAIYEYSDRA